MSRRSINPTPRKGPTPSASGSTTSYITPRGHKKLMDRLEYLWKVQRPAVTREVSVAAAHGDRSENAEYIYGKKKLRQIDGEVRFLRKRLEELEVVHPSTSQAGRVYFGAHVVLEAEDGEELRYQLVGPDEFDAALGRISVDSPLAKALLGKEEGDEVKVIRPRGTLMVVIEEINYDLP
jgi:transcription elongation factor GreB